MNDRLRRKVTDRTRLTGHLAKHNVSRGTQEKAGKPYPFASAAQQKQILPAIK